MSKGKLTYLHQVSTTNIEGDNVIVHEESVSKGTNGLAFKYYHKDNKKKEKILARQEQDGTFTLVTIVNDKKDEKKELTKEQLLKEISKIKNLQFAIDYFKTQKGGRRGSRRRSKKRSMGSKRRSMKRSMGSRRRSMKRSIGSRRRSMKRSVGSRKRSMRRSLGSKKRSMRRSIRSRKRSMRRSMRR